MKRFQWLFLQPFLIVLLLLLVPCSGVSARAASHPVAQRNPHIVILPINFQRPSPGAASDLFYHGGPVEETPTVHVIFWVRAGSTRAV